MNYLECVAYIESLSPTLETPGLTRISRFLAENGNWQNQFPVIHVGGTNGKGSTVAILANIIEQSGLCVGRFTGPHLLKWNERFHIGGKAIEDAEFARLGTFIRQQSEDFGNRHTELGPLTWFEYLAALAFYWFAEKHIDVAVIEVGLGGRFDATNVVENVLASVITNIDLDHTRILGNTVEEIASEKAGIIKNNAPVFTCATGSALSVIEQKSLSASTDLFAVSIAAKLRRISGGNKSLSARLSKVIPCFDSCLDELNLLGSFQQGNALLATASYFASGLAERFSDQELLSNLKNAFRSVYWPGRMQYLPSRSLILDGAHNPAGARALRESLSNIFPNKKLRFVISCYENKDAVQLLDALVSKNDFVYLSEAATRRATYKKEDLALYCREKEINASVAQRWNKHSNKQITTA